MLYGKQHVDRYLATDGKEGHDWRPGVPTLLLTTTGRRSGEEYVHPLIYQKHGEVYLVVASKGGDDSAPDWYRNLVANPDVTVQVWGDRFPARARIATADEKPTLWQRMAEVWPAYDDYQRKTDRDIPVVVLERRS